MLQRVPRELSLAAAWSRSGRSAGIQSAGLLLLPRQVQRADLALPHQCRQPAKHPSSRGVARSAGRRAYAALDFNSETFLSPSSLACLCDLEGNRAWIGECSRRAQLRSWRFAGSAEGIPVLRLRRMRFGEL